MWMILQYTYYSVHVGSTSFRHSVIVVVVFTKSNPCFYIISFSECLHVLTVSWCFTPSQPLRLYQGDTFRQCGSHVVESFCVFVVVVFWGFCCCFIFYLVVLIFALLIMQSTTF